MWHAWEGIKSLGAGFWPYAASMIKIGQTHAYVMHMPGITIASYATFRKAEGMPGTQCLHMR